MDGIPSAASQERDRVRRHIASAEQLARASRERLDPGRAFTRALLLDELARYRRRGRFPLNHHSRKRAVPEFVDPHGTRCAVAHLMDVTGQGELVRHISKTANNARVRELARIAEVRAWLAASGLTLEEAARIQPRYCEATKSQFCFCGGGDTGAGLGTIVSVGSPELTIGMDPTIRIDRIEGNFPGLAVGDLSKMAYSGAHQVGKQELIIPDMETGLPRSVSGWHRIEDDVVRCVYQDVPLGRPVSVDTALDALLIENEECVDMFSKMDGRWNESHCDPSDFENEPEEGCGVASPDFGGAGLTSAALLAALLAYRRRRQRCEGSTMRCASSCRSPEGNRSR